MKTKFLRIDEESKFFDFTENMLLNGKDSGVVKLKNGESTQFKYVTSVNVGDKKVHVIKICVNE